jgi:hypothetical protein
VLQPPPSVVGEEAATMLPAAGLAVGGHGGISDK